MKRRSWFSGLRNRNVPASQLTTKLVSSTEAVKAGLTPVEAEEVVQETMLSVAKKMKVFHYDPARG